MSLQSLSSWFQTGTDTNLAVQVQKMAIKRLEISDLACNRMVLPLGENKGGGKLGGHSPTDLCICFHTSKRQVIS